MQIKAPTPFEAFTDGMVQICRVYNAAAAGDQPRQALTTRYLLAYRDKAVGAMRRYAAEMAGREITREVRVPLRPDIVAGSDVAILGGAQYRIAGTQARPETNPPTMDLTLERLVKGYDLVCIP